MYYDYGTKNLSANTLTTICSLELPAGTYVITGSVYYSLDNARVYTELSKDGIIMVADSGYDSSGYIGTNCCTIAEFVDTVTVVMKSQCSQSANGVRGELSAVKIQIAS